MPENLYELNWQWHGLDICLDLCRRSHTPGTGWGLHSHDFYEAIWVESGRLRHTFNSESTLMEPGDIVFVRPGDVHHGECAAGGPVAYINLSIEANTLEAIRDRYEVEDTDWPWSSANAERRRVLEPEQIRVLAQLFERVDCRSRIDHDLYVLQLIKFVQTPHTSELGRLPQPLRQALHQMQSRKLYGQGVGGLATASGYSREHINRTIRRHLGTTAVALLNALRLESCRNMLRHTDQPILSVAHQHGYLSTAYFYKCFKQRFGVSPRQYRRTYQTEDSDALYDVRAYRTGGPGRNSRSDT